MKLFCVTLTGADDSTDPRDLKELSRIYPFVEWGILLSSGSKGKGRYPSDTWLRALHGSFAAPHHEFRTGLSAHACGDTMRAIMSRDPDWAALHRMTSAEVGNTFDRIQLNFSAKREKFDASILQGRMKTWSREFDCQVITQEHGGNIGVTEAMQDIDQLRGSPFRYHQVLHDASGGRGTLIADIPQPVSGVLNGYAGGLGPENVIERLEAIEAVVGRGYAWIDMESSLRGARDAFDLKLATAVLEQIKRIGSSKGWID